MNGTAASRKAGRIPVADVSFLALGIYREIGAGLQLMNSLEEGFRDRRIGESKVMIKRPFVQPLVNQGHFEQSLDFGGEAEKLVMFIEIKGFDTKWISHKCQFAFIAVIQRKRIHAPETFQTWFQAPVTYGVKNDFGVAGGAETITSLVFEYSAEFPVIEYLAIEHDQQPPVVGRHRLMAKRGQIENREAAVPKTDAA